MALADVRTWLVVVILDKKITPQLIHSLKDRTSQADPRLNFGLQETLKCPQTTFDPETLPMRKLTSSEAPPPNVEQQQCWMSTLNANIARRLHMAGSAQKVF